MTDLDAYLAQHYLDAGQLAAACAIATDELAKLVEERLVPAPSYTITADGVLLSQAFGEFRAPGARPGQYFHPGNAAWVALAIATREALDPGDAHTALERRFRQNFAAALAEFDRTIFRLRDSFADDGEAIREGLDARTADAWASFLQGIFSLCVADPSSERNIARKEILQEALSTLSENGARVEFAPEDKPRLRELVAEYATAAMPFSPLEYPRSSRKRLVEDLGARLGA